MPQDELCADGTQDAHQTHKVRIGALVAAQYGLVTWAQLRTIGVAPTTISRWCDTGYLIPTLRSVYALGHASSGVDARLSSLLLFAGPGAAVSHGTAAYRRGWLRYPVAATHIRTPRQIRATLPGVVLHGRSDGDRELINGLPCTTVTQTLLDLAATEPLKLVFRSLAQLDYERKLKPATIRQACGRGRAGSTALLKALDSYIPAMARTKSELEDDFLLLCQRFDIPIPTVNAKLHGEEPDCYWPQFGLVVELDGDGNHGSPSQRRRDRRKDMKLRANDLTVLRYGFDQVAYEAAAVAADVLSQISKRTA
jgi:hypothetical protein